MVDMQALQHTILMVSSTLAGLSLPAVAIAYFLLPSVKEEFKGRVLSMITLGCLAGGFYVLAALSAYVVILFDWYDSCWLSHLFFVSGCVGLLILFLALAGVFVKFGRKIPEFIEESRK